MIDYLTIYLGSMVISLFYIMILVKNNYHSYKEDVSTKMYDMFTFIILTILCLVPVINTFLVIIIILLTIKDYKEEPIRKWYEYDNEL